MDIFCSTSVLSNTLANSSNEMRSSLSRSASMMVLSAMLTSCWGLMLAPTIMVSTASISSWSTTTQVLTTQSTQVRNYELIEYVQWLDFDGELYSTRCVKRNSKFIINYYKQIMIVIFLLSWSNINEDSWKWTEVELMGQRILNCKSVKNNQLIKIWGLS